MDYLSFLAINAVAFFRNALIGIPLGFVDARSNSEILTGDDGLEGIIKQGGAGFITEGLIDLAGVLAYNQSIYSVGDDNYGGIIGLAAGLRIGKRICDRL